MNVRQFPVLVESSSVKLQLRIQMVSAVSDIIGLAAAVAFEAWLLLINGIMCFNLHY